jgi:hypothetical protein
MAAGLKKAEALIIRPAAGTLPVPPRAAPGQRVAFDGSGIAKIKR